MLDKIKSFFTSKKFVTFLLCLPFLCLIIIITWPFPAILFVDPILHLLLFISLYWKTLISVLALSSAVVLFILYLWPIVKLLLHKIYIYISLYRVCRKNKYTLKIIRSPFASFNGLLNIEDIKIKTSKDTYCIHFVDIISPAKKIIDVSNSQYSITYKEAKKKSKKVKEPKIFDIPEFPSDTVNTHVFFVPSSSAEVRIIRNNNREVLANGGKLNSMLFFYANAFIRMLKR